MKHAKPVARFAIPLAALALSASAVAAGMQYGPRATNESNSSVESCATRSGGNRAECRDGAFISHRARNKSDSTRPDSSSYRNEYRDTSVPQNARSDDDSHR